MCVGGGGGGNHIFSFHDIGYIPILDICCKIHVSKKISSIRGKKDAHVFSRMIANI